MSTSLSRAREPGSSGRTPDGPLEATTRDLTAFGDAVEQLVSFSVHAGPRRSFLGPLCNRVRQRIGRASPLLAAERLAAVLPRSRTIAITTGVINPPTNTAGETDGPIAAVAAARAFTALYGIEVMLLAERATWGVLRAACDAVGVPVSEADRPVGAPQVSLCVAPGAGDDSRDGARRLLDLWSPGAVLAIEKIGRNQHDRYHTAGGIDITAHTIAADLFVEELAQRGGLTIGIGDLGNEIGMAAYADLVHELLPSSRTCQCACGGPITSVTATTCSVIAACSNWGAYGVLACLGALTAERRLLHDAATEVRLIEACQAAGAVDAAGMGRAVDGASVQANACVVTLLGELLDNALAV